MSGMGTKDDPWVLKTPPGSSEYQMWRDEEADPPTFVCQVGKTQLGMYVPPLLEEIGLAELEHNAPNNRVRAT
jgi:hypothetical protein